MNQLRSFVKPFSGRILSLISSFILAMVVKAVGVIAATNPEIAALIDPNKVADFIAITLLAVINYLTNRYHIENAKPVIEALRQEMAVNQELTKTIQETKP